MLINCVVYQEGCKIADIHPDAISDYLDRPGCFVWVAFRDASADELAKVRSEFLSPDHPPASTMIGVTGLVYDELLIEIEAYALVKD